MKRSTQNKAEKEIKRISKTYGVVDPISFLAEIMAGRDPRQLSDIWEYIRGYVENKDFTLQPQQISELFKIIEQKYKYETLPDIKLSYQAADTLAALQNKGVTGDQEVTAVKLTKSDCRNFWKWFDANYGRLDEIT